jgi:GT2 family glycosyltransferase
MKSGDAVCAAWVHSTEVTYSFFGSFLEQVAHDFAHDRRLARGGWINTRCHGYNLVESRNETVAEFLASPTAWLWWLDTDMGFGRDTLDQLANRAHTTDRPIVGALCFTWRQITPDGMNGDRCVPVPTIYDRGDDGRLTPRYNYTPDTATECDATGSACLLVHRTVFETIGAGWYDRLPGADGNVMSEDLSFCVRAQAAGFPIVVDAAVRTTHAKTVWVSEADYREAVA